MKPLLVRYCLIALLLLSLPEHLIAAESLSNKQRARACAEMLQQWYDEDRGVWETTSWWNAANALTTLVHYTRITGDETFRPVIANTFDRCKEFTVDDDPENVWVCRNFINDWHDDAGWWVLVWIDAFDLTGERRYLKMAQTTFADMTTGWDHKCGGGVYWKKPDIGKHSITNGLFMIAALRLHQRDPGSASGKTYEEWGKETWGWFSEKGLVNNLHLVENGLDDQCRRTDPTYYTYNQGVVIGGLVELAKTTSEKKYLESAKQVATATINTLVNEEGILRDPKEPEVTGDSAQFKGVFIRHLLTLYQETGEQTYRDFILHNADLMWQRARQPNSGELGAQFGALWNGPFDMGDAARQSSALDLLNAAAAVE